MNTIDAFLKRYDTDKRELTIRGRRFTFLVPLTIDRFIHADDVVRNFPLWTKIWKASWVLADHMAGMPVDKRASILEIGSGVGVVGIVAASFGHRVTMTEYDENALAFARANAAVNHCETLKVEKMDWQAPLPESEFNTIVGSEVLYSERDFKPLINLFSHCLKPGGQVFLAMKPRQSAMDFIKKVARDFAVSMKKVDMNSDEGNTRIFVCRMTQRI